MNDLQSRLASLSPEQRALLLQKLKVAGAARPAALPPLPRADRSRPLPLSFPQRRLWFLERLQGASAAYNMPAAFRLRGTLHLPALRAAFDEIVRRHEVLRTRLVELDGEPRQIVDLARPLELQAQPGDRATLPGFLRQQAARPFDLATEHPLRIALLQLAEDEHVVFVNIHHVASDGGSTGVLMRELSALYNAFAHGNPSPLDEIPVQYADFAVWQQAQPEAAASLDFWRQQLADAPTGINLPTDFARHAGAQAPAGETIRFALDANLQRQIHALAQASDCSVYQVLLAAFYGLLHRWSGDHDIVVGSPIANRSRPELEGLIGFFANTLALRVDLSGDPAFRALLQRVRAASLAAYAHAELPFEQLVEKINPERRLSQSPFFQVMLAMQGSDAPARAGEALDGLRIEPLPVGTGAARLDMTLSVQDTADGLDAVLEYASTLFRPDTAQHFCEHFRNLLRAALRNPDAPLSQLELLGQAERHRLLVEWNRTDSARDRRLCLHHRVERQARRTPDACALRWGGDTFSYGWLMDASGRIAALLRQRGIGPDRLVGVCMDRTPLMVAALLGVLRAGGAYVALDPAYPPARLRYIIDDSAAPLILTSRQYRQDIFSDLPDADSTCVALDGLGLPPPIEASADAVGPDHLAYVLYTSGSTGQPKGVAIEHHGPAALIDWACSVWPTEELAGVLAGTSICFDLSVFEIFLPLSVGGSVILADNVLQLLDLPARGHVTLVNTVPSAIDALLRQNALPASVRAVNLAGEPLGTELADRVYAVPGVAKVYDLYGPSEDTTYSTFKLRQPGEPPSIGRPIADTQLFILDRALQPVPVGVPGEIYLAGDGLARGYLGRPDLTAERFIPCPHLPGRRMYRTGDLARFRPDGNVEYLGRIDHQVKLRGFRIELGEIESALTAFPGVSQSVVVVAEGSAGNPRLVGYAAHADGSAIADALRLHLQQRLPDYMIPAALVVVPALPLTPNGKIDRKALPAPDGPPTGGERIPPASPREAELAAVWSELLGVADAGRDDDFFALGGHSLLAVRLQSRLRERFHCEASLRDLFEHSRLHQQAALLDRLAPTPDDAPIPTLPRRDSLPLSFAQERLWFLDQLEPGNPAYNMPGALRLRGPLDVPALARALERLVARHEILRLAFQAPDGTARAVPTQESPRLAVADLRGTDADAAQRHLRAEAHQPFDLAHGPLLRATLLHTTDDEAVLALTLHHAIADGWSVGLLLRELCALYDEARSTSSDGGPAGLPPLTIQYADFAAWQRERHRAGRMDGALNYWRAALQGAPALLALPTDRPRPAAQGYRGATLDIAIPAPLAALLAERRQAGTTDFMALLAAYAAVLARHAGQDDVVIGFPAAGRARAELEALPGLFVNTLPIRLRPGPGTAFGALLQEARDRTLEALAHQELPFEKLVDALGVERSLAWSPLFQALLVVQNAPDFATPVPGLMVEPIEPEASGSAKFDLSLYVAATGTGGDGLRATFEYDTDLFDRPRIAALADGFLALLEAGLRAPQTLVNDLPGPATVWSAAEQPRTPPRERAAQQATPESAPAEQVLAEVWREVLRRQDIGPHDNYFALGGDSILSIVVIAKLRERGWLLQARDIFRHQTLRDLAPVLRRAAGSAEGDQGSEDDGAALPLSPLQQMFFDLRPPTPQHFNQSLLLCVDAGLAPEHLAPALAALAAAHPALRSRFAQGAEGWRQAFAAPGPVALHVHPAVQDAAELERLCDAAQRSLDLGNGPVFRADLFTLGLERRLLLVAHHLVVDAVSWRVLLADLESALAQARAGAAIQLPPEYCGPARHRRALQARAASAGPAAFTPDSAPVLPARDNAGPAQPRTAVRRIDPTATRALLDAVQAAHDGGVADLLLTALGTALCRQSGRPTVLVDMEGHGRDMLGQGLEPDLDLSRSVGWFTALRTVRLPCPAGQSASDNLARVRAALHGASDQGAALPATPLAEVCFNYLGQSDNALPGPLLQRIAPESPGAQSAADLPRRYLLDCNVSVLDGELVFHWGFDALRLDPAWVDAFAAEVADTLATLTAQARNDLDELLGGLDLSGMDAP